jgi:hypothetical protein
MDKLQGNIFLATQHVSTLEESTLDEKHLLIFQLSRSVFTRYCPSIFNICLIQSKYDNYTNMLSWWHWSRNIETLIQIMQSP